MALFANAAASGLCCGIPPSDHSPHRKGPGCPLTEDSKNGLARRWLGLASKDAIAGRDSIVTKTCGAAVR